MKKFIEKFKLIHWLCSDEYEETLRKTLPASFEEDLLGVCETARQNFPFLNQGYFGDYEDLKKDTEILWGVDVQEVPLPRDLLGVYVPEEQMGQGNSKKSVILINKNRSPLFKLTTLAHELSHVPVYRYFKKKCEHVSGEIRMRNRVALFADSLKDPEEVLPDVLTTLGAYPRPDFQRFFSQGHFGLWSLLKSFFHLPRHYPELIGGFFRGRDLLLNLALVIHFLRLRYFLYHRFQI